MPKNDLKHRSLPLAQRADVTAVERNNALDHRKADAVAAFMAEKKRLEEEEAARVAAEAEEQARLEREANPTTEDLLKQILEQMKK